MWCSPRSTGHSPRTRRVSGPDGSNQGKSVGDWIGIGIEEQLAAIDRGLLLADPGTMQRPAIGCTFPTPLPRRPLRQFRRVGFAAGSGWTLWRPNADGRTANARNGYPHGCRSQPWRSIKPRLPQGHGSGSHGDCIGRYRISHRRARSGWAALWSARREYRNVCTRFHRLDPHDARGQLESSLAGGQHRSHADASLRVSWQKTNRKHRQHFLAR